MSTFIGAASPQNILEEDDTQLYAQFWRVEEELNSPDIGFVSPWWPGASGMGALGDSGDVGIGPLGLGHWFEAPETTRGSLRRFAITGTARDAVGIAAAFATVYLYHTSDGALCDIQTCDAFGYYYVTTPFFPDAHFVVVYQANLGVKPDAFGTTVNTLVGA